MKYPVPLPCSRDRSITGHTKASLLAARNRHRVGGNPGLRAAPYTIPWVLGSRLRT